MIAAQNIAEEATALSREMGRLAVEADRLAGRAFDPADRSARVVVTRV